MQHKAKASMTPHFVLKPIRCHLSNDFTGMAAYTVLERAAFNLQKVQTYVVGSEQSPPTQKDEVVIFIRCRL